MQSYDYSKRKGVEEISWERFGKLANSLAEHLAVEAIEVVIGIARAGLFPATTVACVLRREFFPVRITRRVNDQVTFQHPVWKVDVPKDVAGKTVAVIDEMADTGETLGLVAERIREQGAARVVTASLVSHSWANPAPAHVAFVTDALVIFPWDKHVYQDGHWIVNPELAEALKKVNPPLSDRFSGKGEGG
jgi:uncharacterized protein